MAAELGSPNNSLPPPEQTRTSRLRSWKSKAVAAASVGVPLVILGTNSPATAEQPQTANRSQRADGTATEARNATGTVSREDGPTGTDVQVRQTSSQVGNVVTYREYVDGVPTGAWTDTHNEDGSITTLRTENESTTKVVRNADSKVIASSSTPVVRGKLEVSSRVGNTLTTTTYINGTPTGSKSETVAADRSIRTVERRNGITTEKVEGPNGQVFAETTTQVINGQNGPVVQHVSQHGNTITTTIADNDGHVISHLSETIDVGSSRAGFFSDDQTKTTSHTEPGSSFAESEQRLANT